MAMGWDEINPTTTVVFSSPVITVKRATTVPSYEVHASRLKYRNIAMVCNCSLNIQEPELSCIRILKTLPLATNHSKVVS